MKYGLIGEKLGHSYSKEIHNLIGKYEYELCELNSNEFKKFMEEKDFLGINVTIPYKEKVIPYLDEISPEALKIGAVNTIVNKNGKLYGYNTDYFGLKLMIEKEGIILKDKKVLILGSGGTSKTAFHLAIAEGAKWVKIVSRSKKENVITYDEVSNSASDAEVIINTTPVGMYPNVNASPINIENLNSLEAVVDVIYNPINTKLVLSAKERKIKATTGLYMLVAQAFMASEKFLENKSLFEDLNNVYEKLLKEKENIILIGMPGAGKSTIGKMIAKLLNKKFIDIDEEIEKKNDIKIKDMITENGEEYFRNIESKIIEECSLETNTVIATGGGAILRKINIENLKKNGKIYFLNAPLEKLQATSSRPLSNSVEKLKKLYEVRFPIYNLSADFVVDTKYDIKIAIEKILEIYERRKDDCRI